MNAKIREDEFGPTHCAKCGAKFGEPYVIGRLAGVAILGGMAYADYDGSVLCEVCADEEEAIA